MVFVLNASKVFSEELDSFLILFGFLKLQSSFLEISPRASKPIDEPAHDESSGRTGTDFRIERCN